jgi:hypothetical protein
MPRLWRLTKGRIAVIVLAAAAAGYPVYRFAARVPLTRTFRIGFQNSAPYHFAGANGQPTGPTVETVSAAARRAGIELEWVFAPDGPESALTTQGLDLWPVMADPPAAAIWSTSAPPTRT